MAEPEGFVSVYVNVSKLMPHAEIAAIWQAIDLETYLLRLNWHGGFELTLRYDYVFEEIGDEKVLYDVPAVEGRAWSVSSLGVVAVPYVEPDIVLRASGEFAPFIDDWGWQLWVREEFLKSPEGQRLGTALLRAKLALDPGGDD